MLKNQSVSSFLKNTIIIIINTLWNQQGLWSFCLHVIKWSQ